MLYLSLLGTTNGRIKFQNYLFKADKIMNHHLGHNRIFPADRIRLLLQKIKWIIAALLATGNNSREILELSISGKQKNKLYLEFIQRI
jgi:hypothetical protein